MLSDQDISPRSVVEPSCGHGNFLFAALEAFPSIEKAYGYDINGEYTAALANSLKRHILGEKVRVIHRDFFVTDWKAELKEAPDSLLILGNPPWATSAELGKLGAKNLPFKCNKQKFEGLDALTGKSNFDISEWMIIRMLEQVSSRKAVLAMLCKTPVARKVLRHVWTNGYAFEQADIYLIDAKRHFNVNADACLLTVSTSEKPPRPECRIYNNLDASEKPLQTFGFRDGKLISDAEEYEKWKHLQGQERYKWRSGIKHDCCRVMELRRDGERYFNGFGDMVELEPDCLFPMLKSSDLSGAAVKAPAPTRWMIVTQKRTGESTAQLKDKVPRTWEYLMRYAELLDNRKSSIYRNRSRFSIFGVGEYSFKPWKIAISGLYKKLHFKIVGPYDKKPTMMDDTCCFISCERQKDARFLASLLNSKAARRFYESQIFWDNKRPITIDILRRLDLLHLARELQAEKAFAALIKR